MARGGARGPAARGPARSAVRLPHRVLFRATVHHRAGRRTPACTAQRVGGTAATDNRGARRVPHEGRGCAERRPVHIRTSKALRTWWLRTLLRQEAWISMVSKKQEARSKKQNANRGNRNG